MFTREMEIWKSRRLWLGLEALSRAPSQMFLLALDRDSAIVFLARGVLGPPRERLNEGPLRSGPPAPGNSHMGAHQPALSFPGARSSTATKTDLISWGWTRGSGVGSIPSSPRLGIWRCHMSDGRRGLHASEGDETMFSVGQRVWHRDGQRSGTVLECDGDRVFIAQDNGAELDFRASDLTLTPPGAKAFGGKPKDGREAARTVAYVTPSRTLTSGDITPEHVRVLAMVPVRTVQAVAALFERKASAGKFSALNVAEKLNVIAQITAVPYRTMREYSDRPGELGLLMGKGLADSSKTV
jgi:hypothetical protein